MYYYHFGILIKPDFKPEFAGLFMTFGQRNSFKVKMQNHSITLNTLTRFLSLNLCFILKSELPYIRVLCRCAAWRSPLKNMAAVPTLGGWNSKKKSAGSSGSMSVRGMTTHTSRRKPHGGLPPSEKETQRGGGRGGGVWIISGAFLEKEQIHHIYSKKD